MVEIRIDVIGQERFVRGFNRITKEIGNFREPFEKIYDDFLKMEKEIFDVEGKPKPFDPPPLQLRYAAWKKRKYPGKKMMQLKGRLIKSLTAPNLAVAGDVVRNIKKTSAEFGSQTIYAHRHQVGWHMPMRKIVQLTDERKKKWAKIIHYWAWGLINEKLHSPWGGRGH